MLPTKQPPARFIKVGLAAAGFAIIYYLCGGGTTTIAGWSWAVPATFLGLGTIATILQEAFWDGSALSQTDRDLVWATILTPACCLVSTLAIWVVSEFMP